MLLKKELLFSMIDDIKGCTIVGVPSSELKEIYFKNGDLLSLFDKHNIEYKVGEFEDTSVGVYFPNFGRKQLTDLSIITISNPNKEQIENIIKFLFEDVLDYYQVSIPPKLFLKAIKMHSEELTFGEMLLMIPEKSQSKIAEKVGKSRQAIGDIKSGKNKLTLEVLSKLMNLYPLLPWLEFIEQYNK